MIQFKFLPQVYRCMGGGGSQAPPPPPPPAPTAPVMFGAKDAQALDPMANKSNARLGKAKLQIPLTPTPAGGSTGLGIPS